VTGLLILPVAVVAGLLLLLALVNEFRLYARMKAASARLERGEKRGGYVHVGQRKLP
jgi:hypothetical protein